MSERINIVGQRFGHLTVTAYDGPTNRGRAKWSARCDCGIVKSILGESLRSGATTSCGCFGRIRKSKALRTDLSNRRFGSLVAIEYCGKSLHGKPAWKCKCDCGAIVEKSSDHLVGGVVVSCGCVKNLRIAAVAEKRRINVIGLRFGRLIALSSSAEGDRISSSRRKHRTLCQCDCGTKKVIPNATLIAGRVISCGCAIHDQFGELPEKVRASASAQENVRRARKAGAPGRYTADDIDRIYRLQLGKCAWCFVILGQKFHRDHRIPLARCGTNDASNIDLLCPQCNTKKNATDPVDWAQKTGRLI